eukprot:gnl/TRDRNA2_/TRDRNA2_154113_c0_seq1.p1 gnl/TRDRNA2_/TRDRNA2_154113_c0~~gnl/TRDRNA2_/TRDRNA2_154113_c0_seq1.p1  ORF type:complete len:790 (+),score=207.29 gnl/TRDRNA2_/TRDRNA2_154113_c0_seq1:26-2395(+)
MVTRLVLITVYLVTASDSATESIPTADQSIEHVEWDDLDLLQLRVHSEWTSTAGRAKQERGLHRKTRPPKKSGKAKPKKDEEDVVEALPEQQSDKQDPDEDKLETPPEEAPASKVASPHLPWFLQSIWMALPPSLTSAVIYSLPPLVTSKIYQMKWSVGDFVGGLMDLAWHPVKAAAATLVDQLFQQGILRVIYNTTEGKKDEKEKKEKKDDDEKKGDKDEKKEEAKDKVLLAGTNLEMKAVEKFKADNEKAAKELKNATERIKAMVPEMKKLPDDRWVQLAQFIHAFHQADNDGDGELSPNEWDVSGYNWSPADLNHDGMLQREEVEDFLEKQNVPRKVWAELGLAPEQDKGSYADRNNFKLREVRMQGGMWLQAILDSMVQLTTDAQRKERQFKMMNKSKQSKLEVRQKAAYKLMADTSIDPAQPEDPEEVTRIPMVAPKEYQQWSSMSLPARVLNSTKRLKGIITHGLNSQHGFDAVPMLDSLSPWRRAYFTRPDTLHLGDGNPAMDWYSRKPIDATPEWFAAQTDEEYRRAKHDYMDASRRRTPPQAAEEKVYTRGVVSKAICKAECENSFKECTDTVLQWRCDHTKLECEAQCDAQNALFKATGGEANSGYCKDAFGQQWSFCCNDGKRGKEDCVKKAPDEDCLMSTRRQETDCIVSSRKQCGECEVDTSKKDVVCKQYVKCEMPSGGTREDWCPGASAECPLCPKKNQLNKAKCKDEAEKKKAKASRWCCCECKSPDDDGRCTTDWQLKDPKCVDWSTEAEKPQVAQCKFTWRKDDELDETCK